MELRCFAAFDCLIAIELLILLDVSVSWFLIDGIKGFILSNDFLVVFTDGLISSSIESAQWECLSLSQISEDGLL